MVRLQTELSSIDHMIFYLIICSCACCCFGIDCNCPAKIKLVGSAIFPTATSARKLLAYLRSAVRLLRKIIGNERGKCIQVKGTIDIQYSMV